MARVSEQEVSADVRAKLQAAGGRMSHRALVEALQTEGKGEYVRLLPQLVAVGGVVARMEFESPDAQRAVTVYGLE